MAEFIAQEEMDRDTGYWWSPDERHIALARVDESPVAEVERFEIQATGASIVRQRYPATGTPTRGSDLFVADLAADEPPAARPRRESPTSICRAWTGFPDSRGIAVQRQSRDQKTLELLRFDALTGRGRVLLTERSETLGAAAPRAHVPAAVAAIHLGVVARRIPAPVSLWQRRQAGPPAHLGRIHGGRRAAGAGDSRRGRARAPRVFHGQSALADRTPALLGVARRARRAAAGDRGRRLAQRHDVARTQACSSTRSRTPTRRRSSRCARRRRAC